MHEYNLTTWRLTFKLATNSSFKCGSNTLITLFSNRKKTLNHDPMALRKSTNPRPTHDPITTPMSENLFKTIKWFPNFRNINNVTFKIRLTEFCV